MSPHNSIASWLSFLGVERRCSSHTLTAYARDVRRFIDDQQPLEQQLSNTRIRAAIASMSKAGMSASSIARATSALRSFVRWATAHQVLASDFSLGKIVLPKIKKSLPKVIDVDTAKVAVELKGDDSKALRDRALLETIYGCGVRLSEALGMTQQSIIEGGRALKILGKGNRERIVPLGSEASKALSLWIKAKADAQLDSPYLFVNLSTAKPLTARGVQYIIRQRGIAAGIDINLHPHLFRHAFASHILESSGDLRAVQELLGHANLSTTQVYTHLNFQHLAEVYDRAHPRAKRKD